MRAVLKDLYACVECKQQKPGVDYFWRNFKASGPARTRRCIECMRKGTTPFNRTDYNKLSHATRNARGRIILRGAKRKPCADCAISYPLVCMDFDHVRGTKRFSIGTSVGRRTEDLLAEIAKCDVVCSNCHRIRTQLRRLGLPSLKPKFPKQERVSHAEEDQPPYLSDTSLFEALGDKDFSKG